MDVGILKVPNNMNNCSSPNCIIKLITKYFKQRISTKNIGMRLGMLLRDGGIKTALIIEIETNFQK